VQQIPQDEIPQRLADIFRGRKEMAILFEPEVDVSYEEIITLLDKIEVKTPEMSILLITPRWRGERGAAIPQLLKKSKSNQTALPAKNK
jgi:hypothetical protein